MEPSDAKPVSPAALDKGCTCSPTLNCNGEGVSSDHALRSRVAGCTVVSSATGLSLLVWRGRKNRATCNDVRAGSTLLKLTQPFSGVVVDPSLGLGLRSESWTTRPIASDVLPTARPTGSNVSAVHSRVLHDLKCDGYAFSRIAIVLRHGLVRDVGEGRSNRARILLSRVYRQRKDTGSADGDCAFLSRLSVIGDRPSS
jgi:hypothetical protein